MRNESNIYGILTGQEVTFIGCTKGDVPPKAIKLQTVTDHPKLHWVKWCVRFRRTLKDQRGVEHPLAKIFKNSFRVKRLLDVEAVTRAEAEKCEEFLAFHTRKPHLLADMVEQARAEKAAGRRVHAIEAHICNARWSSDSDPEHADDTYKIKNEWAAWYSRLIQMECPDLIGFFRLKPALADGLVVDGRSWRDFVEEHEDELHYDEFESLEDSEWESNG
jgi:hypothetical protein